MSNKPSGKEMADMLTDFVNNFNTEPQKEFAETIVYRTHRTLQQSVFGSFLMCIQLWAKMYDEGNYDLRNEETCKQAKQIMNLFDGQPYVPMI